MRRCTAALTAIVAALLIVAGCGGNHHATHITPAQQAVQRATGHPCNPDDFYMQCALTAPPRRLQLVPGQAYGVDFAWSCPQIAGSRFGASYLSYDTSKNWTRACLNAYHAAGKATVAVWETTASRAGQGCSAGASDAREAIRQLAADGAPAGQAFTMAIDFDASGPQVAAYFACAHQVAGDRANAYGGYTPLSYLCAHHLVGRANWQTYAWSGGRWLPASCAPLEQYLNGGTYDNDRAISPDYGQWPLARPPSPPSPAVDSHHVGWYRTDVRHDGRSEQKTVRRYRGALPHEARYPAYVRSLERDLFWFARRLDRIGNAHCNSPAWGLSCPHWQPRFHQGWRARHLHAAAHGQAI